MVDESDIVVSLAKVCFASVLRKEKYVEVTRIMFYLVTQKALLHFPLYYHSAPSVPFQVFRCANQVYKHRSQGPINKLE